MKCELCGSTSATKVQVEIAPKGMKAYRILRELCFDCKTHLQNRINDLCNS